MYLALLILCFTSKIAIAETGTGAGAYKFDELPGRRYDAAQRCDDGSVRPGVGTGSGKSLTTFAVSLGIVVVHGILVAWFWHMIPIPAAHI